MMTVALVLGGGQNCRASAAKACLLLEENGTFYLCKKDWII